uniref:CBM21 domain-containing protein n=1 Tax=Ixodes ricinus TaxID=34613 RepID=A0A131XX97_IXORI
MDPQGPLTCPVSKTPKEPKQANVLNRRDADSIYRYLPRNLSSCQMCAELQEQHLERKMRLLGEFFRPEDPDEEYDFTAPPASDSSGRPETPPTTESATVATACASPKKPILRHRSPAELRSDRDWVSRGLRRKGRLVTFADALGLELEHVRRLVHHQQVPLLLPPSATKAPPRLAKTSTLVADFKLPDASKLAELVQRNKVCLKSVSVREESLHCRASVANLTFHKKVSVRYTTTNWTSHVDWAASYVASTPGGAVDEFAFTLVLVEAPRSLQMALRYETEDGRLCWDNNGGRNYSFRRVETTVQEDARLPCNSWLHWL